jgi:hypothetical protein
MGPFVISFEHVKEGLSHVKIENTMKIDKVILIKNQIV